MKKTVCIALTNRTNYSKLKSLLLEIKSNKNLNYKIILSSSILLERYGSSYNDLLKDGFLIHKKIDCVLMNDSHEAMAKTIGISTIEHATYFADIKPDLLLIVGDRYDMLAPVVSASTMNIPIAHIQGGETSGTIDNVIRHVLTKFSSLHFVSTKVSAQNLINNGVSPDTIYNFGCPAVEYINSLDIGDSFSIKKIRKKFKEPINIKKSEKFLLVLIHPDTTNHLDVDMLKVLEIINQFRMKTFLFYPNVDANNTEIVSGIAKYNNNRNFIRIRHMPIEDFIYTMAHASCMIGNSSAGIREAASFGTPVIDIGYRQKGREKNQSTFEIGDNYSLLKPSIDECLNKKYEKQNIYYKKDCSKNIMKTITEFLNEK